MNTEIKQIVERANKALGSSSSRGTFQYCEWLEKQLIIAERQVKKLTMPPVIKPICQCCGRRTIDYLNTKCSECGK